MGARATPKAGINLNPYQGLKLVIEVELTRYKFFRAGINLKPYQGLKHFDKLVFC